MSTATLPDRRHGIAPELALRYENAMTNDTDMREHVPRLHALALQCEHVTEFGVRHGVSTTAFLHAQPATMVCVDIKACPIIDDLQHCAGRTALRFICGDSRKVEIDETDLLFIDTLHNAECLNAELVRHADKVRNFIVLHDTEIYGVVGEGPGGVPSAGHKGLWEAIERLTDRGEWCVVKHYRGCCGLTILGRGQQWGPLSQ